MTGYAINLIPAMNDRQEYTRDDRELLIRLDEKLEALRGDVRDLKDGFAKRLDCVESDVEKLKEWKWKEAGAIGVVTTALTFLIDYLKR